MEMEVVVERCAFLDVHRDTVMACARTPDGSGGRREDVAEFGTTTSQLLVLADWLAEPPARRAPCRASPRRGRERTGRFGTVSACAAASSGSRGRV